MVCDKCGVDVPDDARTFMKSKRTSTAAYCFYCYLCAECAADHPINKVKLMPGY